jgi:chromate transport protein ChrA
MTVVQFYYYTPFETHTHKTMYCAYFKFFLSALVACVALVGFYVLYDAMHFVNGQYKIYEAERLALHYRSNTAFYGACNATALAVLPRPWRSAPQMIVIPCDRLLPFADADVVNQTLHDMAKHLHDEWDYTGAESYNWCLLLIQFIVHEQIYWFDASLVIVLVFLVWLFGRYGPWRYARIIKYQLDLVAYHPPDKDKSVYEQEQFSLNKKVE